MHKTIKVLLITFILSMPLQANIYHVVICWLKEPQNTMHKQKLIEATKQLKSIEGVESIKVGQMVSSPRKVVDSSYDVGIIFEFKNKEMMQSYLSHPLHKKALKEVLAPLTSKVVIYDFEEI